MNFKDYEWLRKRGPEMGGILDDCLEAERSARIRPLFTRIVARRALENIYKERCDRFGLEWTVLAAGIGQVFSRLSLPWEVKKQVKKVSHEIRESGNEDVHPELKQAGKAHAATEERIKGAMEVLEKLYWVMRKIYGDPRNANFDQDRVPFDEYEITRKIADPTTTAMTRSFVKGTNGRMYLLQCLSNKEMAEFEKRRQDANKRVYENRRRHGDRLLLPNNIPLPYESDRKLLLYDAYPESSLLSERRNTMKLRDALKLGLDLIEALEKLKQLKMHHRSIYPGCIMVEAGEDGGYEAYLMDLHTSKIENSNETVNAKLAGAYDTSLYVPDCLRGRNLSDTNWEKVDVYAVCRVVLFCLDSGLVTCSSTGRFRDYKELHRATGMNELYERIFDVDPGLEQVPTLAELKEIFQNEYHKSK